MKNLLWIMSQWPHTALYNTVISRISRSNFIQDPIESFPRNKLQKFWIRFLKLWHICMKEESLTGISNPKTSFTMLKMVKSSWLTSIVANIKKKLKLVSNCGQRQEHSIMKPHRYFQTPHIIKKWTYGLLEL